MAEQSKRQRSGQTSRQRSVFIVNALSGVPKGKEWDRWFSFISSVGALLTFEHNIRAMNAVWEPGGERKLAKIKSEKKRWGEIFSRDINLVNSVKGDKTQKPGFIVALTTHASTGMGSELHEAAKQGIPIIFVHLKTGKDEVKTANLVEIGARGVKGSEKVGIQSTKGGISPYVLGFNAKALKLPEKTKGGFPAVTHLFSDTEDEALRKLKNCVEKKFRITANSTKLNELAFRETDPQKKAYFRKKANLLSSLQKFLPFGFDPTALRGEMKDPLATLGEIQKFRLAQAKGAEARAEEERKLELRQRVFDARNVRRETNRGALARKALENQRLMQAMKNKKRRPRG